MWLDEEDHLPAETYRFEYQNRASRKRSVLGLSLFSLFVLVLSIGARSGPNYFYLVAGIALGVVAYRNQVAGVFLNSAHLALRNILTTRKFGLDQVKGMSFDPGSALLSNWSYLSVDLIDGRNFKVTAFRRNPIDGVDLVSTINAQISSLKTT